MHKIRHILMTVCIILMVNHGKNCYADEALAVIVARSNPLNTINIETLKLVYLRKMLLDNQGTRWIPLNLPSAHPLRISFSLSLFKNLPDDQESYWNEQYFQGVTPPHVLASEEAVIRFIAITPGAIGYVSMQNLDDRVKVLKVLNLANEK